MKIPHSAQQHAKFQVNPQNTFRLKNKGKDPHKRGLNDRLLQLPYNKQLLNVAPLHWSCPRAEHKQQKPLTELLGTMHTTSFKKFHPTLKDSGVAFQPGSSQYSKAWEDADANSQADTIKGDITLEKLLELQLHSHLLQKQPLHKEAESKTRTQPSGTGYSWKARTPKFNTNNLNFFKASQWKSWK